MVQLSSERSDIWYYLTNISGLPNAAGEKLFYIYAATEKSLRAEEHDNHQKQRINDHAVLGDGAESLGENGQEDGGHDDADDAAHAADYDHHDNLEGAQEAELGGVDVCDEMGVQSAGNSGEKGAGDKGDDFVAGGVDADRFGGDFIVAHRQKAFAVSGIYQIVYYKNKDRGHTIDPEEIAGFGDAGEAAGGAEKIEILYDDADNLAEAQSDDGQIIALKAQAGNSYQQAENRGDQSAANEGDEKEGKHQGGIGGESGVRSNDGGSVCTDRHKSGVAERKLAGETIDKIEAGGEDNIYTDIYDDLKVIGADGVFGKRQDGGGDNRGKQIYFGTMGLHHDFFRLITAHDAGWF